jgi:hypothetical protein
MRMSNMNQRKESDRGGALRRHVAKSTAKSATKAIVLALAITSFACVQPDAIAGTREQAKRMFDRLTGTPPSEA